MLTVSPVALQRVLEHVKCPGQSALGAVLLESVECVSVYSTCVLTVSPVARQRVLEHVKCPGQSALGAVLPKSVECVSVYSTLCAHCFTCCSTACAGTR